MLSSEFLEAWVIPGDSTTEPGSSVFGKTCVDPAATWFKSEANGSYIHLCANIVRLC